MRYFAQLDDGVRTGTYRGTAAPTVCPPGRTFSPLPEDYEPHHDRPVPAEPVVPVAPIRVHSKPKTLPRKRK